MGKKSKKQRSATVPKKKEEDNSLEGSLLAEIKENRDKKYFFVSVDKIREILSKIKEEKKEENVVKEMKSRIGEIRGGCMWFDRKDLISILE